jgi:hypothetical protein
LTLLFGVLIVLILSSRHLIIYLRKKRINPNWLISLALINLLVVVPELALRTVHFHYESGIEFGYPRPSRFMRYEVDEKLFWKLNTSDPDVNSWGFPGKEIVLPKPPLVFRVLFLGDSCTQQGFPEIVEQYLNLIRQDLPYKFESISLAIAGYSSHQGRIIAETYGLQAKPDMVVVYYGWNDHWQAYKAIDSEKKIRASRTIWTKIYNRIHRHSCFVQLICWFLDKFRQSTHPLDKARVRIDQYRDNLLRIYNVFEPDDIPVIFITAPTSHYRFGVPDYLLKQEFVRDKESAVELHKKYNQIVRVLVQENHGYLLDLEKEFNRLPDDQLRAIFSKDGIHFTDDGLHVVAGKMTYFINETVMNRKKGECP